MREHEHPQSCGMEVQHAEGRRQDHRHRVAAPNWRTRGAAEAADARRWFEVLERRGRRTGDDRMTTTMRLHSLTIALVAAVVVVAPAFAQTRSTSRLTGSWEA